MEHIQVTLHIVNIFMFLYGCVSFAYTVYFLKILPCKEHNKSFMYKECAIGILICILFVVLQIDWVLSEHNESVGDATSYAWLVFDYLLAMYLIWNSERIRYFAKSKILLGIEQEVLGKKNIL